MERAPMDTFTYRLWSILWYVCFITIELVYAQNESLVATDSAKYLTSPGYPTSYPNNLIYEWLITSSVSTELVKIEVPDCEIEYLAGKIPACQLDSLEIFDGEFDNATMLYQSCCITSVPSMNSSGPNLLIRFTTDSSDAFRGFKIKYYNTAYVPEDVAAAFGLYIAIAVVAIVIIFVVAVGIFYIYKMKKSKEARVNPDGIEQATTSSTADKKYREPVIDEYNKPPLPSDSPIPAPNAWSESDGMRAPENLGPKPDLILDQHLPDGNTRGNRLPPLNGM